MSQRTTTCRLVAPGGEDEGFVHRQEDGLVGERVLAGPGSHLIRPCSEQGEQGGDERIAGGV